MASGSSTYAQNDGLLPTQILGGRRALLRVGNMAAGTFSFVFDRPFVENRSKGPWRCLIIATNRSRTLPVSPPLSSFVFICTHMSLWKQNSSLCMDRNVLRNITVDNNLRRSQIPYWSTGHSRLNSVDDGLERAAQRSQGTSWDDSDHAKLKR